MKHKMELLQDVQATLESAIRIRQEKQVFNPSPPPSHRRSGRVFRVFPVCCATLVPPGEASHLMSRERARTGATEDSGCGRLMSTLRNNNNKIGQDARHRAQGAGGGKGPGAASTRHRQHAGLELACASCLYVLSVSVRAAKALARDLQGRQDVSAKDSRAAAHPCDADLCFLRCRWRRTRRQICRQKCARAKPMSSIT